MNKKIEKIKDVVYPVIAAVLLIAGGNALYAWTAPTSAPPKGNVAAPINVGSVAQTKKGAFGVEGNFAVFGNTVFSGKIKIADGTQAAGKVLISDAAGNASWAPLPAKPLAAKATKWVLKCAAGSREITYAGLSFCGYTISTGQTTKYCNGTDELIRVADNGNGRNHGITKVPPNGCTGWEGTKNYGGGSCELTCKSSGYVAE